MDYVKIGGKVWNVSVLAIERNFNILDTDNAGRVIASGEMVLDRIGTYYGHKVTFARGKASVSEYDELWEYLSKPRNTGIPVDIVYGQKTLQYEAYISSGNQQLKKIDAKNGVVYWNTFDCNFVPMKAQVTA